MKLEVLAGSLVPPDLGIALPPLAGGCTIPFCHSALYDSVFTR